MKRSSLEKVGKILSLVPAIVSANHIKKKSIKRNFSLTFSQGIYQDKLLDFEGNVSNLFDSDPIIEHCFRQFKQKDFQLPESRRRIIILPQRQEPVPRDPTLLPTPPPPPVPSYKALENGDIQGQPEDRKTWLNRRLRLRKELESFGDVKRWLENKPSITPSEAKVLHMIHRELDAQRDLTLRTFKAAMVSCPLCQMTTVKFLGMCCHFSSLGLVGRGMLPPISQGNKQRSRKRGVSVTP